MLKLKAVEFFRQDQCYNIIRLNPDQISQYQVTDKATADYVLGKTKNLHIDENALIGGTSIYLKSGTLLYVKETPDELDKLIEEDQLRIENRIYDRIKRAFNG